MFILILFELAVTIDLHKMISWHIFVGVLLSGPLVLKMLSVGYRFFRYYTGTEAYVKKGPPNIWLRLLAPFLVLMTVLVFASGFSLVFVGPRHDHLFFEIHAASVALWIPMVGVHVYAYLKRALRLASREFAQQRGSRVRGRGGRVTANVLMLAAGAGAAAWMLPLSTPWHHARLSHGVPSPLALGLVLAVCGVIVAFPLLRMSGFKR